MKEVMKSGSELKSRCPVCGRFASRESVARYEAFMEENARLRDELEFKEELLVRLRGRGFWSRLFNRL